MRSVILRPLAVLTITFYILSCILFTADATIKVIFAVIFFFILVAAVARRQYLKRKSSNIMARKAMTCLSFLALGALLSCIVSFVTFDVTQNRYESLAGETCEIRGNVTDVVWDGGYSAIYVIDVEETDKAEVNGFSCVLYAEGGIERGSYIEGKIKLARLEEGEGFNERRYYLSKGIVLSAEAEELFVKGAGKVTLKSVALGIRDRLSDIFVDYLGKESGGFASALFLGEEEYLSDEVSRDFGRLGIVHVLAISGMHLTVICAFVSKLLGLFGRKVQNIGCIAVVVFYLFITGFSGAVTRAGIMVILIIAISMIGRGSDSITNLGVSVFLITIFDPCSCADVGLQLSFCAVMAIFLYYDERRPLKAGMKERDLKADRGFLGSLRSFAHSMAEGAALTVIIILFMLPLEWYYFRELSLISPLTSPFFSIVGDVLLWALPVLLILSPAPTFASVLSYALRWLIELICHIANSLSHLENVSISLNYPLAGVVSVLVMIAVVVFCVLKGKKRIISLVLSLSLLGGYTAFCCVFAMQDRERAEIIPIEYKSNDGMLVSSCGECAVIDVGNGYSGVINAARVSLGEVRATEIEALFMTHLHRAYVSSVEKALRTTIIRKVYIPDSGELSEALVSLCDQYGAEGILYFYGDTVKVGETEIRIEEPLYIERSVQPVVSLTVSAHGEELVYLGASYVEAGGKVPIDAEYIWYGDHGPLYKESFVSEKAKVFAGDTATDHIDGEYTPMSDVERLFLGKADEKVVLEEEQREG